MLNLTGVISINDWPPVPFRVAIPGYPSVHFTIVEVAPSGTRRSQKWQSVSLDTLERTIRTSTLNVPTTFTAGVDDISPVSVTEYDTEFPVVGHRQAMASGLQALNLNLPSASPAQIRGVFAGGPDLEAIFGFFEASFSITVPRIPEQWTTWPGSMPLPPNKGTVLSVTSLWPVGDGWDSKHFSTLLQSTIEQLNHFKASGQTAPIGIEAVTPAKDWSFSNQISGQAPRYTLDMQIVLLTFLRQLVMQHGVVALSFDVLDRHAQFITGGHFKFSAYGEQIDSVNGTITS